jgi:hypothetical protein
MDATDIDHLVKIFKLPRVKRALAELRAAILIRGDLDLGDECLTVYQEEDGELVVTSVRVERDDTREELDVVLSEAQRDAAEHLWSLGVANRTMVAREIPSPYELTEFLAKQGDCTAMRLGVRLNADALDQVSVYPAPLPKP